MARGQKRHLKRLNAPKHWMLSKLGGTWAPRPSTGPHKMRDCLPMCLILKNRLKYALTRKETMTIVKRRLVHVDGKVRTDINYPAGFMDVVSIEKTKEQFRLLYDSKGRFVLHRIKTPEEAKFKLCRVRELSVGSKASIGQNPLLNGNNSSHFNQDTTQTLCFITIRPELCYPLSLYPRWPHCPLPRPSCQAFRYHQVNFLLYLFSPFCAKQ